ncbi:seryl-tRNA synthetase [Silvibacterium bohemicum]|uniref:Serine--tRNA ligase n=1 Tax=Silvibacterium bohemicum TaxID=1577686 RepID=A0A841JUY6_9BACT|nr:serine--tRNA ligase [Silvibacterium bohemicum]MBB6142238.1 seryl-tRNA synthetase [Silvibacterium bohemicum]
MLDLAFVRSNLELVEKKLRDRGQDPAALLGNFRELDQTRRERITESEKLQAERNRLSTQVGQLKKSGQDASAVMEETKALKERMDDLAAAAAESEEQLRAILMRIPNLPADDVPVGKSEHDNAEVKRWGDVPNFDFPARPHWEIGEALGILDFERAAKISGARFVVYWAAGARLERALANFMLDVHTGDHGYTEVMPPVIVNSKSLFGTGQLPKFAEDLFRSADEEGYQPGVYRDNDHWLIPTAEVPVTNLYRDETLDDAALPTSLVAYTPCFRSEAGSYGKDVRGIIRQHQFQKVELVKFVRPEDSEAQHEKLTRDAETILELLGLPYRRMLLCSGDMGFASTKTYDLEVWLPGQQLYREISSCSNFGDFQARRASIRYRPKGQTKGAFLHTVNGSGLAIGRTWLAILENYQQADGTVKIPEALIPYMGGQTAISGPKVSGGKEK